MQQLYISGAPNSAQQQNMFAPTPGQSILASIGGNAGQSPSHIGDRSANGAPNAGQSIMAMLGGGSTVQAQGNGMPQLPPLPSDARTVDSIAPSGHKLPPLPSIAAFPDDCKRPGRKLANDECITISTHTALINVFKCHSTLSLYINLKKLTE